MFEYVMVCNALKALYLKTQANVYFGVHVMNSNARVIEPQQDSNIRRVDELIKRSENLDEDLRIAYLQKVIDRLSK